jgi:hypothetical protein
MNEDGTLSSDPLTLQFLGQIRVWLWSLCGLRAEEAKEDADPLLDPAVGRCGCGVVLGLKTLQGDS